MQPLIPLSILGASVLRCSGARSSAVTIDWTSSGNPATPVIRRRIFLVVRLLRRRGIRIQHRDLRGHERAVRGVPEREGGHRHLLALQQNMGDPSTGFGPAERARPAHGLQPARRTRRRGASARCTRVTKPRAWIQEGEHEAVSVGRRRCRSRSMSDGSITLTGRSVRPSRSRRFACTRTSRRVRRDRGARVRAGSGMDAAVEARQRRGRL